MLSIEQCKRILLENQKEGCEKKNYSEEEIIFLRETINRLISIEFDYYQKINNEETCNPIFKGINRRTNKRA